MAQASSIRWKAFLGWTGRHTLHAGIYPVDLFLFTVQMLGIWRRRGHLRDPAMRRTTLSQLVEAGTDSLPVILLLGLVIGFTFALPLLMLSPRLAETQLAPVLLQLIGLELGPLLTATVLIGRAGRAMAVELANMKLHGEARGLERLGIHVGDFFAAPRIVAASVAQLVLATYFTAVALFGGMLLAGLLARGSAAGLAMATLSAVETGELVIFIVKNLVFGLIVASAACYSAMQVGLAPSDVPARAQQAATHSLLLVFLINGFAAALSA